MHGARRVEPRAHAAARDGLLDGAAQLVGRGQLGLQLRATPRLRVGEELHAGLVRLGLGLGLGLGFGFWFGFGFGLGLAKPAL